MIPVSSSSLDSNHRIQVTSYQEKWQLQQAESLKNALDLLCYLKLDINQLPYGIDTSQPFTTRVPKYFADLIDTSNPWDPLLMQILPLDTENMVESGYETDPLLEQEFSPVSGLIHKYKNRVLLIAHQACAIHCRYCFRRHFPYQEQRLNKDTLTEATTYIAHHTEINEVILSGGDPLSLSDTKLESLITTLEQIPHVKTLRIHSRTPVVLPARITTKLADILLNTPLKTVMVLHINHPNEISEFFVSQLKALIAAGVTLLNQTVLLKNINDLPDIQVKLSEKLFQSGVLPYYLHQLDYVAGASHFRVTENDAQNIWNEMQARLSGYLLPRLVQEIPRKPSKTWINLPANT